MKNLIAVWYVALLLIGGLVGWSIHLYLTEPSAYRATMAGINLALLGSMLRSKPGT